MFNLIFLILIVIMIRTIVPNGQCNKALTFNMIYLIYPKGLVHPTPIESDGHGRQWLRVYERLAFSNIHNNNSDKIIEYERFLIKQT